LIILFRPQSQKMILSCLCACVVTMASANDSLIALLHNARNAGNRTLQSTYHNTLGYDWYHRREYDSALHHFRKALRLSESLKNDTLAAQYCNNVGMVHYQLGNPDSALTYYERA